MKGITLAWLTALTISTVNSIRSGDGLPTPGVLVGDSLIMAALALVGEAAPTPAALAAWGYVIAAVLINPKVLPGPPAATVSTPAAAPAA